MNVIIANDTKTKAKWDNFIQNEENGTHLQLSTWLESYKSYGFDYEILIIEKDGEIVGGLGAVIAKVLFFKFYIVPNGPVVRDENNAIVDHLLKFIPLRAKKINACYCQVSFPVVRNLEENDHYSKSIEYLGYLKGNLFKYVYSSNGLNWLDFQKYNSTEEILLDFKSSVRRDIKSAERKEQEIRFLTNEEDIKTAYNLCLENAKNNNYSIRDWNSFKDTMITLIGNGSAKFIAAYKENEIKGAIFIVKAGNYYTYILGGTKKEKPDLLTGHLLQWEAIKISYLEKCVGYNISLGGSEGVKDFKNNFVSRQYLNEDAKFYVVLNKKIFNFFLFFEKKIKPQKKRIAKLLTILKRKS